jgi:Myb/SANT-like DNA-binding domain
MQKPKEASVRWINTNRKFLISALLKHSKGPISSLNNSKTGWNSVVADFYAKTNLSYNKEKLTHQVSTMKKNFIIFDKFTNNSGFGVDARGAVTDPPEALNTYFASNPKPLLLANLSKMMKSFFIVDTWCVNFSWDDVELNWLVIRPHLTTSILAINNKKFRSPGQVL